MGYPVSVINVFSKINFIYESIASISEASAIRKREDKIALKKAGVENILYMDLPGALLRGYSLNNLFIEDDNESWVEMDIVQNIRQHVASRICSDDEIFIPAAFGSHIDHLLVRTACQEIDIQKKYFADLPYAADDKRYKNRNAQTFLFNKKLYRIHIDHESINNLIELCKLYRSQFLPRFVDEMTAYFMDEQYVIWG